MNEPIPNDCIQAHFKGQIYADKANSGCKESAKLILKIIDNPGYIPYKRASEDASDKRVWESLISGIKNGVPKDEL